MEMQQDLDAAEGGLCCRIQPAMSSAVETLIYLPGLHGDWTLLGPFRAALGGRCRLVEFAYPRRTDWALEDYADAILGELERRGLNTGWVLAESFASQISWAMTRHFPGLAQGPSGVERESARVFLPRGMILVGGFVRHPVPWGVDLARKVSGRLPLRVIGRMCKAYARLARRRCGEGGAFDRELDLFVARRSMESDRAAITSRYRLIRDSDLRPLARRVERPVYSLTGALDPIVPWPPVGRWLRRWCPGFRGSRILWGAGHNVLLDRPGESAEQILAWVRERR